MIGNWTWVRQGCRVVDEKHRKVAEVAVSYCDEAELNRRGQAIAAVPKMIAALEWQQAVADADKHGTFVSDKTREEMLAAGAAALSRALTPEEES